MENFATRFKKALEIRNLTAAEFSRISGTSEGTVSQYKKGLYEPKQRRLEQYSKILNVSIPWLMGADVPMEMSVPRSETVSDKDKELLKLFSRLDDSQKQEILVEIALKLSEKNNNES